MFNKKKWIIFIVEPYPRSKEQRISVTESEAGEFRRNSDGSIEKKNFEFDNNHDNGFTLWIPKGRMKCSQPH